MFNKECSMTDEQLRQKGDELIAQMTDKEKAFLCSGNWDMAGDSKKYKRSYNPVPILSWGCKRLGVEPIGFSDGPRGVVMGNSTCFPVSMARSASFDRSLEERIGEAIGREARAGGANYFGGVCVNLLMHPAGGRAQESYGEDTYLVGEMGASLTKGVQKHNVMACVKHYAVNNMENKRFSVNVNLDERTLREVYLPHFKKCFDAGAASVMGSYNRFRGDQASESRYLLTDILRDDWGFEGFSITDFFFALRSGEKAMNAGMDMEMPVPAHYGLELLDAIKSGKVSEERINEACRRILMTQMAFENAPDPLPNYGSELIACDEHVALAQEAAEKGMVLIKNKNVLPLAKDIKKLLVVGHLAVAENTGDHGSSAVYPPHVVTVLDGLKAYLGEGVEIIHCNEDEIDKAKTIAPEADVVIIVAGNDYNDEGECVMPDPDSDVNMMQVIGNSYYNNGKKLVGKIIKLATKKMDTSKAMGSYTSTDGALGGDRKSLSLKQAEIDAINAIAPLNKNTVVSLVCGSLLMTKEWDDDAPAILYSWYSGMEGGTALARVLFGDVNPSGKLPFVIPADESQLDAVDFWAKEAFYPYYNGYRKLDHDGNIPAYPFGYGLSYTSYEYSDAVAEKTEGGYKVSCMVKNTGNRDGEEAVQAYVSMPESAVERHVKKLCGFEKVMIKAGEAVKVEITVPEEELKYYDPEAKAWVLEDTLYKFGIGANAGDLSWV